MNLKDLFFENKDIKKPVVDVPKGFGKGQKTFGNITDSFPKPGAEMNRQATTSVSFPTNSFNKPLTVDTNSCGPYLDSIMEMYEKGFDSLNQDGYDFYEYFKGIIAAGASNNAAYSMAFNMAKSMDNSVNKTTLLSQSEYYLNEIKTVHLGYVNNGDSKRKTLESNKINEESQLKTDLNNLQVEIDKLTTLKLSKEHELSTIDNKYSTELNEIECKIMENDVAKDKIVSSIELVVNGIKNNLK